MYRNQPSPWTLNTVALPVTLFHIICIDYNFLSIQRDTGNGILQKPIRIYRMFWLTARCCGDQTTVRDIHLTSGLPKEPVSVLLFYPTCFVVTLCSPRYFYFYLKGPRLTRRCIASLGTDHRCSRITGIVTNCIRVIY